VLDIRIATIDDVPSLSLLLREYMRELFKSAWNGSPDALARDGLGLHFEMMVVARGTDRLGFAAWKSTYDLHHCLTGGEIVDLYVHPEIRGRGIALQLVAAVASIVRLRGGSYIKGLAVGDPSTRRLYERLAMTFDGADCIVGGRAFRCLADLAGKPARSILQALPDRSANYEP
jgi:ribosomal protein S18 acetylase RimI-like enzyme